MGVRLSKHSETASLTIMTFNQPHLPPLPQPPLTPKLLGIPSEAVEKLAYQVYVENDSAEGRTVENWAEAERRLMAEYLPRPAVRRVPGPKSETKTPRKTKKAPAPDVPAVAEKKRSPRGPKPKS